MEERGQTSLPPRTALWKLYRIQQWFYLLLGLGFGALSIAIHTSISGLDLGLAGIPWALAIFFAGGASAITFLPNLLAVRSQSTFGWWTHFWGLIFVVIAFLFLFAFGKSLYVFEQQLSPLRLGLYAIVLSAVAISFIVAFRVKAVYFGGLGVTAPLILALVLVGGSVFNRVVVPDNKQAVIIADLQTVGSTQGKVTLKGTARLSNGELEDGFSSVFSAGAIELPDLPESQYYAVWLTDTGSTVYHPVTALQKNSCGRWVPAPYGVRGGIPLNNADISLGAFPVLVVSPETLYPELISEGPADRGRIEALKASMKFPTQPSQPLFKGQVRTLSVDEQEAYKDIAYDECGIRTIDANGVETIAQ